MVSKLWALGAAILLEGIGCLTWSTIFVAMDFPLETWRHGMDMTEGSGAKTARRGFLPQQGVRLGQRQVLEPRKRPPCSLPRLTMLPLWGVYRYNSIVNAKCFMW